LELFYKNINERDYFNIPMTREDIANHIGLSKFTVSRTIIKLQKEKIIDIKSKGRKIKIIDIDKLKKIRN
jgi:DNA-binding transcriptional regulator LsrR (DeoR family)